MAENQGDVLKRYWKAQGVSINSMSDALGFDNRSGLNYHLNKAILGDDFIGLLQERLQLKWLDVLAWEKLSRKDSTNEQSNIQKGYLNDNYKDKYLASLEARLEDKKASDDVLLQTAQAAIEAAKSAKEALNLVLTQCVQREEFESVRLTQKGLVNMFLDTSSRLTKTSYANLRKELGRNVEAAEEAEKKSTIQRMDN